MLHFSTQKTFAAIVLPAFAAINLMPMMANAMPVLIPTTPPPQPIQVAIVSGKITNAGSNNGGAPKFNCNQIKLYPAVQIIVPSTDPDGIATYQEKKIGGLATVAGGSAAAGCTYTLTLTGKSLNRTIHLVTESPQTWTTAVNSVEVSPKNWGNPKTYKAGQNLKADFQIRATLIK
jgi:hypothetical protein